MSSENDDRQEEHDRRNRFVSNGHEDFRILSPCGGCVHKHSGAATCEAFPDGIPLPILAGKHDHKSEYPGDNGIRYEPNRFAGLLK